MTEKQYDLFEDIDAKKDRLFLRISDYDTLCHT